MELTKTQLVAKIRDKLGNPLTSELADSTIQNAIDDTLVIYSKVKPKVEWRTLQLSSGTAVYPVTDVMHVAEVIIETSIRGYEMDEFIGLHLVDPAILNTPWLNYMRQKRWDYYEAHYGMDWEFIGDSLRFTPAPTESRTVAYQAQVMHTLATIPTYDQSLFMLYAQAECKESMGNKRNRKITQVPISSGTIAFDDGEALRKEAVEMKERFYAQAGANASAVDIG